MTTPDRCYWITKSFTTKREAWLKGDLLSWRGPRGGKFDLEKKAEREWSIRALVSGEAVDAGEVKQILETEAYGIQMVMVEK